ncbi:MAG: glycosyltransferase [Flavobacteriales bacterium]|nr:glycosyltransferase [Flavobacteriales bacterium]
MNVLILPDLFPKNENDWVGVFVVDYIKSIIPNCMPWVFYSRLVGENQVAKQERFASEFDVYRWNYKQQISALLKPIYYLLWFKKTVQQITALNKQVDIIHAHGAILNGTVAFLLSKQLKVPFVISEHTGPFSKISNSFVKKRWAKYILNRANKVFAVSSHLKGEMVAMGIRNENISVSFNPVDTNLFQCKSNTTAVKNILFVSRLEPFKGGLRTLKAFHKVAEKNSGWCLTICGEGPEKEEIINYVQEFKLEGCVTIKDVLTKPEYVRELHQASFLVFPSLHESFGLIPVEAMTCGLPVITTNATAMPEYINEQNGVLLNTSSVDEISEAINSMINNLSTYNSVTISENMNARFGIENFGKMLVKSYQTVITNYKD